MRQDKLIQLGKNKEVTNRVKCMELLDIVRTVLDLSNGAYCCRCNKSLGIMLHRFFLLCVKCMELLDMVRSVLDLNGLYCCRCNKSLGKKDMKRCNGCNCMTYCSKACQKEDWLNGHNITCNKPYIDEQSGQFQGRMWPSNTARK